ncbi:MAG: AAA family ATPase [Planctomycetota bacterium]
MLLKRIEAKTLPEAIERVRTECGPDALVVETRATRNGFLVVAGAEEKKAPVHRDQAGSTAFLSKWTRGFRPLAEKALEFGLSRAILEPVERALLGTRVQMSKPGDPALPALAARVLAALIHTEPRVESSPGFQTLALVGPTGVGKTTTLAKLAARARERGERVAVITLDTYRMAAVEQLRAFAELLDVPFSVALSADDVRRAMDQNLQADRIYIDTTGKSPRSRESLPILEGTLRAVSAQTLLCMCAGTRRRDSQLILDAYEPLGVDAVCLTKWDETVAPGESLASVVEAGLPLSHLCVGQEVPADILAASGDELARAAFDCELLETHA